MKRIQYSRYGGPEWMAVDEFELSAPGAGEVAVRVRFAAVNPIDWKLRNGQMKIVTGRVFPRAMGMDFSGTVMSVGPGVIRFRQETPYSGSHASRRAARWGRLWSRRKHFSPESRTTSRSSKPLVLVHPASLPGTA